MLDNIENLIESMADIGEDIKDSKLETDDEDIISLSERIKELQAHINKIIGE